MTQSKAPPARGPGGRPTVRNADVPSESEGLPGVGEGASARHFARDLTGPRPGADDPEAGEAGPHVPADPRAGGD